MERRNSNKKFTCNEIRPEEACGCNTGVTRDFLSKFPSLSRSLFQLGMFRCTRQFSSSARVCSHIGKTPIPLPPNTSFNRTPSHLTITGPLGSTSLPIPSYVNLGFPTNGTTSSSSSSTTSAPNSTITSPDASSTLTFITPNEPVSNPKLAPKLQVSVEDEKKREQRRSWGLTRTLISNAIQGQTEGFTTPLHLIGVGFRAAIEKDEFTEKKTGRKGAMRLNMKLGYSHPVYIPIPEDIKVEVPIPTRIVLKGTDKQRIGQFAANIRQWRKPEPYKGKVCALPFFYFFIRSSMSSFFRAFLLATRV